MASLWFCADGNASDRNGCRYKLRGVMRDIALMRWLIWGWSGGWNRKIPCASLCFAIPDLVL